MVPSATAPKLDFNKLLAEKPTGSESEEIPDPARSESITFSSLSSAREDIQPTHDPFMISQELDLNKIKAEKFVNAENYASTESLSSIFSTRPKVVCTTCKS